MPLDPVGAEQACDDAADRAPFVSIRVRLHVGDGQAPRATGVGLDGTPGDAVAFGLSEVFADRAPGLVVSATNFGPNVAALAIHSGTVGGAVAVLESGVPATTVSTGGLSVPEPRLILNAMRPANDFAVKLIECLRKHARNGRLLPSGLSLNVDLPVLGADGTGTVLETAVTTGRPAPARAHPRGVRHGEAPVRLTVGTTLPPARLYGSAPCDGLTGPFPREGEGRSGFTGTRPPWTVSSRCPMSAPPLR
ncbi:5'/3'-nucleotidase SurE [Streptomyces sp. NPDC006530]|uniref:5'/3'-nucleotidase SurE n=1 Tax=Streptomyces sp. NPDC006530 TaxID=3364750 RepID=UPI003673CDFD